MIEEWWSGMGLKPRFSYSEFSALPTGLLAVYASKQEAFWKLRGDVHAIDVIWGMQSRYQREQWSGPPQVTLLYPYQAWDLRLGGPLNWVLNNRHLNGVPASNGETPGKPRRCFQSTGIPEDNDQEIQGEVSKDPLSMSMEVGICKLNLKAKYIFFEITSSIRAQSQDAPPSSHSLTFDIPPVEAIPFTL